VADILTPTIMSRLISYLVAVGFVIAAALGRIALEPLIGHNFPWATFYLATLAAAIYGGMGPGLLAFALGAVVGWTRYIDPTHSFAPTTQSAVGMTVYLAVGLCVALLAARLQRAQRVAIAQAEELRQRQTAIGREVEQRRQAEAEIARLNREIEHRLQEFELMFRESPIGIAFARDPECREVWANPAFYRIVRLPVGADLSWTSGASVPMRIFQNGGELTLAQFPMQRCIATGEPIAGEEFELRYPDGAGVVVLIEVVPLLESGRTRGCIASVIDITERKRTEEALRTSEMRERERVAELETIMEAVPAVVFIAEDPSARVIRTNRAGEEVLRLAPGRNASKSAPLSEVPVHFRIYKDGVEVPPEKLPVQLAARGQEIKNYEEDIVFDDGTVIHLMGNAVPLRDDFGNPRGAVAAFVDITERKRAEAALREREELFRGLAEGMPHMVWETDANGKNHYQNQVWYDYIGDGPGASFGDDWLKYYHPDDREYLVTEWRKALSSGGDYPYDIEARIRRHDGVYRWFRITGAPVKNHAGQVIRWTGTCTDVDDQRRAQESLREADRRKDEFLATLGHELRNPLAPMRNAIEIIRKNLSDEKRRAWALEIIDRQLSQLSRIIDDLLELSRIASGRIALKKETTILRDLVSRAVETARPVIEAKAQRLRVELPPAPVKFEADTIRLVQVLTNLLSNAAKYTPRDGTILIAAFVRDGALDVRVRDTGEGIDPKILPRIFDMFRRGSASTPESGLGIGLAFARRIVELHGGRISATSEGPGKGSEFRIVLPISAGVERQEALKSTAISGHPRKHKRVLVVDDNQDAADSMAELLKMQGHEVACLYEGSDVVATSLKFQPDLVLLDIGLPNVDGYEIARRFRANPALRSLPLAALTGRGQETDKKLAEEVGFNFHFTKPVDPSRLMELLQTL
jgi:PAS domain S-box-containing protein